MSSGTSTLTAEPNTASRHPRHLSPFPGARQDAAYVTHQNVFKGLATSSGGGGPDGTSKCAPPMFTRIHSGLLHRRARGHFVQVEISKTRLPPPSPISRTASPPLQ